MKTLFLASWLIAVCLVAVGIGKTSAQTWIVLGCLAVIPPAVVRHFWRVREQTLSESINEARR